MENISQPISQKLKQTNYHEPICGFLEHRAKISVSQEKEKDLTGIGHLSLEKYLDSCGKQRKKIDPSTLSTRMLKECLVAIEDLTSLPYSLKWMKSGTMRSGSLSTLPITSRKIERGYTLSDILESEVDEKYFLSQAATERILSYKDKQSIPLPHEQGGAASTGAYIVENKQHAQGKVRQIGTLYPESKRNKNQGRIYDIDGIAPALNCMEGGNRQPFIVDSNKVNGINLYDENGKERPQQDRIYSPNDRENKRQIRKLTPRECFRLQGWGDEYFDRAAAVNSDTQLYKQAGNGMTVNVVYEIGKRME